MSIKPKQSRSNGNANAGSYGRVNNKSKKARYDFDDRQAEKRRRADKLIREYREKKEADQNEEDFD